MPADKLNNQRAPTPIAKAATSSNIKHERLPDLSPSIFHPITIFGEALSATVLNDRRLVGFLFPRYLRAGEIIRLQESGTDWLLPLVSVQPENRFAMPAIAVGEVRFAIGRRQRAGDITPTLPLQFLKASRRRRRRRRRRPSNLDLSERGAMVHHRCK